MLKHFILVSKSSESTILQVFYLSHSDFDNKTKTFLYHHVHLLNIALLLVLYNMIL